MSARLRLSSRKLDTADAEPESTAEVPTGERQELLTVEDIAAKLQVPPSWVYSHANHLGALRLGKYVRFEWNTVLKQLRDGQSSQKGGRRAA